MKTIDAFLYNGERDLLEIRLNILAPYVDEFIIVEAKKTFRGKDKDLFYNDTIVPDFLHKITYHVNDCNYTDEQIAQATLSPNTGGQYPWIEEYLQREAIKDAITHLKDDDIVFVSDCDEIWNPKVLGKSGIYKLEQLNYCYQLNNRTSEPWSGTFRGRYGDIKDKSLNELRANPTLHLSKPETWGDYTPKAGWHFSNCMPYEEVVRKLESFSHEELDNEYAKDALKVGMEKGIDFLTRGITMWIDESDLPEYILKNKEKYKHLIRTI